MKPIYAFLRFEVNGTIANKVVDAVTLRLTATDAPKAPGNASGEIWEVESFTMATLATTVPAKLGNTAISPNQGAVTQNQEISWPLPSGIVAPNTAVFLGLYPLSTDGVNYWNNDGAAPPQLIIDYH
jgi:hypothetical protein